MQHETYYWRSSVQICAYSSPTEPDDADYKYQADQRRDGQNSVQDVESNVRVQLYAGYTEPSPWDNEREILHCEN